MSARKRGPPVCGNRHGGTQRRQSQREASRETGPSPARREPVSGQGPKGEAPGLREGAADLASAPQPPAPAHDLPACRHPLTSGVQQGQGPGPGRLHPGGGSCSGHGPPWAPAPSGCGSVRISGQEHRPFSALRPPPFRLRRPARGVGVGDGGPEFDGLEGPPGFPLGAHRSRPQRGGTQGAHAQPLSAHLPQQGSWGQQGEELSNE